MFDELFKIKNQIEELELYSKIGLKYIKKSSEIIQVAQKINSLKDTYKTLEDKIKSLYF